jgi:hypothetical protein
MRISKVDYLAGSRPSEVLTIRLMIGEERYSDVHLMITDNAGLIN